ncbi:hypothetical protein BD626DRAFT_500997 [Schizophyllum amplum]|uniref:Uncharacterized protein n=1 Tax=Schizophyllum amplum TaxID=97359 RepID=A0A550C9F9_9AGAR|nr:hypothetical protein BD626DRAFT_500997 [Auriculariopsis ampla]
MRRVRASLFLPRRDLALTLFDVVSHSHSRRESFEKAIVFARRELLREAEKRGYNILLHESWSATLMRRAERTRVQVKYSGRGASADGVDTHTRQPPFLEVLRD